MKIAISATLNALLEAVLVWMLARLTYGSFCRGALSDTPILIVSFVCTMIFEVGLRTLPKSAEAKPESVRVLAVYVLTSLLAFSYAVIAYVYPDWLHESASVTVRLR